MPQPIENFVVNLSSVRFSEPELGLLNKGLKYAISPSCAPLAEIVNNIESSMQFKDHASKSAIRHNIKKTVLRAAGNSNNTKPAKFDEWCAIRQLKAREVVYSRADKGNSVVIMDKGDYDSRVLDMIRTGPYEEHKFKNGKPKDPLNAMVEGANKTRQTVARLVGDEKLERSLLVSNPKVASLYCLPKIHKNPLAMRPISSNVCTPTEKLAAWLVNEMVKYPVSHGMSVKNSVYFVEQLEDVELRRGEVLVSFDVSSLFPSVPVVEALRSLRDHLVRKRVPLNYIEAYTSIASQCMDQNFFTSWPEHGQQNSFGLSLGSKISPLLAEVFMSDFEVAAQKEKLFPRIWKRYVDDIFAIVKERYLPQTLDFLNSRHPSIKFTVERETNGKLPFLDLLISRKDDNKLKFGIYRKPTSTDRYITIDSNHFGTQKQAAFHALVHRLVNIPMAVEEFVLEKENIYKTAELNGYEANFVDRIIRKHERKKRRNNVTTLQPEKTETKRISLPFYPKVTNSIQKILRKHKLQVVYKSGNVLRDLLGSAKDKVPPDERSGIYEIPCQDCSSVYLGQTRRKVKTRLKEHKSAVENQRTNESSVAVHSTDHQHNIDWEGAKLIKSVIKTTHLNAWESFYITTTEKPLMNEDEAPIISPLYQLTKLKM